MLKLLKMNTICQTIKEFIKKYDIENNTYLVGFSGGYDSMCLLHALKSVCNNRIIAIHLNHNWRGEESDREEQNCIDFCKQIGVEFYSEKLPPNTPQTETVARNLRYEFFENCAKKFDTNIIFTAHNKNDNAETLIYRIAHGTGVSGLQGISEKRPPFYRPILNIERTDIEKYCKDNNLSPNFDSSNNDTIHKRNLIRSEIMPQLQKINPNTVNNINSLSQIAKEETEIVKEYVTKILENITKENKILTQEFFNQSDALQKRILYETISPLFPQDYDQERIYTIWKFLKENKRSKSGKIISLTTDKWIFINEKYIEIITKQESKKIDIHITKEGEYKDGGICINISKCDTNLDESFRGNGRTVFVDLRGLDFDFHLRTRQEGDIIQPLGMNGTQKLKKYLNSRKIPNHEKDNLLFLTQGKEILWAIDIGLSDKIKIKTKPTHKITITIKD